MLPQLSQLGASSWNRENCSLCWLGAPLPSIRRRGSTSAFFAAPLVWPFAAPFGAGLASAFVATSGPLAFVAAGRVAVASSSSPDDCWLLAARVLLSSR